MTTSAPEPKQNDLPLDEQSIHVTPYHQDKMSKNPEENEDPGGKKQKKPVALKNLMFLQKGRKQIFGSV